jgi:dolichyl-phosphate beta-glucosyltransferase
MHARGTLRGQGETRFSLIFPTYNPGPALAKTWLEIKGFLDHVGSGWEIIFVCDGCTDGTPELLDQLRKEDHDRVHTLVYSPNRGKGYAVRQGLAASRAKWALFTDVDLAYRFEDIVRLAEVLEAGADVAIASRVHADSRLILPPALQGYAYRRHLQSLAFSWIVRRLLPLTNRDTQAGLKGLSAHALRLVLPHLTCDGFGFDCDLLTGCARFGLAIQEVPVWVRYDDAKSTTGLHTTAAMIRELLRIRRAWKKTPEPAPKLEPRIAA